MIYEGLPKISENLLVITWILTLSPNFHRHLRSSHLGLVNNDPSDFATFGSTLWVLPALACLVSAATLLGSLQWRRNVALSTGVSFSGTHRNRRGRTSPVMTLDRKWGSCLTAFCSLVHTWTWWSHCSFFKRRWTNFAAIRLMLSSSARMCWHDPYDSPTLLQTSWIVCLLSSRITSSTSAIISGVVHVDGRPECLSSSTDSWPSLKRLNHSNVPAWLKACSPKASVSIRWVSAAVLLNLKQNLMQVFAP